MASTGKPVIFFHVGEPKTGTTFLQQVIWQNRPELAHRGISLPGHRSHDHFRASLDLRDVPPVPTHPDGSWAGDWDVLAAQARRASDRALISHELFAAVTPAQSRRAIESLRAGGADVHMIFTVRDMATLLPAEWQETIKHRNTTPWLDWLSNVIDKQYPQPKRRKFWFWKVHDTAARLDMWSKSVGDDHIHVIVKPPSGAPSDLLWRRLATVIGLDPAAVDITKARANASLGINETEALRRLNMAIGGSVPKWYYARYVKEQLAHDIWEKRRSQGRLQLPVEREAWAKEYAENLVGTIKGRGYHVVGELDELYPVPAAGPGVEPDDAEVERMLELAAEAAATFLTQGFRMTQRIHNAKRGPAGNAHAGRGVAAGAENLLHRLPPGFKRKVRDLSSRHASVRRLRILVWRMFGSAGAESPDA